MSYFKAHESIAYQIISERWMMHAILYKDPEVLYLIMTCRFWLLFMYSKENLLLHLQVCQPCIVSSSFHMWTVTSKHRCNIYKCSYDGRGPG